MENDLTMHVNISLNKYVDMPVLPEIEEPEITESYEDQISNGKVFDSSSEYRTKLVQDALKRLEERRKKIEDDDAGTTESYEDQIANKNTTSASGMNWYSAQENTNKFVTKRKQIHADDKM